MKNIAVLLGLLNGILDRADVITALLNKANKENRDVLDSELDALAADDDVSRIRLEGAITKARSDAGSN